MDLRQLAALTAVADHRSFSAAARALHTVQSNVSTHVARLERELGTPLVDRKEGTLTPSGAAVVARARLIQAELEALIADVASVAGAVSGTVRLGVIGTTGRWLAPPLLRSVALTHPRIHLVLVDATTTSLAPQLAVGHLDLAVVNLPLDDPDVEAVVLFEEDLVVVAPSDHPLAATDRVELSTLARHPLLLEPTGTAFRDDLDREAGRAGVILTPQAEVDGMRLLATLAFEGHGAAVLPASAVPPSYEGAWHRIAITDVAPRSVGLAGRRRARLSAPGREVRDSLRAVVAEEVPHQPGLRLVG